MLIFPSLERARARRVRIGFSAKISGHRPRLTLTPQTTRIQSPEIFRPDHTDPEPRNFSSLPDGQKPVPSESKLFMRKMQHSMLDGAGSWPPKETVLSLTGWGVLLVVAVAVVAAIVLIIRLIVRHTRGYD